MSVYTTGSVTSSELQSEDWEEGDRLLATTTIDFDNQGTQVSNYIYNATISGIHQFDCKDYLYNGAFGAFQSDTLPSLYSIEPFINYRKDDTILTFAYVKYEVESGEAGSLELIQPKMFDFETKTDTLYLVYNKGNIKESKSSDYISFKLPQYPVNTDINVVVRYQAASSNFSTGGNDKTSRYFSFTYNRPETLE